MLTAAPRILSLHRGKFLAGGLGVGVAAALKAFYSDAGSDQLLWILAPSSWVARFAGGIDLHHESGRGFVSHTHHLVVGAPCAGVNFLVIAFLTLLMLFMGRVRGPVSSVVGALALAYAATVVTNGLRIVVATHLFELDIYGGAVTPERVHRLAGTVIYYGSLLALYRAVETILKGPSATVPAAAKHHGRRFIPLGCYLLVSVGIPLVGRLGADGRGGRPLGEHALLVVGVTALLTALAFLPSMIPRASPRRRDPMPRHGLKWGT